MSEGEERTLDTADFKAARGVWWIEMNTGPDPYADPLRRIGGTTAEDDEGRES